MEAVAQKNRIIRFLDSSGDRRLVWRKESPDEVKEAKKAFREALAKGGLAYKVDEDGQRSSQIREFDPNAEEIVVMPMVTGG